MTKILLVEDDKSLREIYGVRLLAEGYDIVTAGDGEEALAMAIKERPQLIVSDVMMPKISGFDMLDILRSTSETKDIKVIMMTALSSEDQRARGEALGADRYLVKSQVGIEDVVRTVHEVIGDAPTGGVANPNPPQQPPQMQPPMNPTSQQSARPAPSVLPGQRPEAPAPLRAPAPQPMPTSVAAPQPQLPQTPPAPQPAEPPRPQQPQPPQNVASGLPQPTAPFSTNRPAGLGDRIIHPISQPDQSDQDIASRMQQELEQHPEAPVAPTPQPQQPQPMPEPAMRPPVATPDPVAAPSEEAPEQDLQPTPQQPPEQSSTPAPQLSEEYQTQPVSSTPESHGIEFEETPRMSSPAQPPVAPPMPGGPAQQ